MGAVNLLRKYPKSKRNTTQRAARKTAKIRSIARKFGKEFFDGNRLYGYGGFRYNPRFWQPVIPDFIDRYGLTEKSSILDVGCAKGFMLYDFTKKISGIKIAGIDISEYAIQHALPSVRPYVSVGNAKKLPFPDASFDLVVSINTVHNLPLKDCKEALREITRVSKKHAFIMVDAYRNKKEKKAMEQWNLTARTVMHVTEWVQLFKEVGYTGDYYWFIP